MKAEKRNNRLTVPIPSGSVTLVGAGPGDPELLTLKAVRAISKATVILVDDLVNDAVLAHANASARIVHVGKRGGCQSTPQSFIEKMMVLEYQRGGAVVRLKGGDPLIFGRAGEEMAALDAADIPYTIVNGITSSLAAAATLGVTLTHRDHAHGVLFVTGHAKKDGEETNWSLLGEMTSKLKLTLVIYMGTSHVQEIQSGLMMHTHANTPVALIQNVSCINERRISTELVDLVACIQRESLKSPLIMVIGDVTRLTKIISPECVSLAQEGYNTRLVA